MIWTRHFLVGAQLKATFVILLIGTLVGPVRTFQALYSPTDVGLKIVDSTNFTSFLEHKQKLIWLEYYNSWCGHCIRFAPTWKELAKDIVGWSLVVEMAVIDCAEDRNQEICREYEIYLYPSLKYYWINYNALRDFSKAKVGPDVVTDSKVTRKPEETGILYEGKIETIEPLRHGIIDFLEKNWRKGAPREWPDLMAFSALSKDDFIRRLPLSKGLPIMVVVEKSDSYIGREVILDLSGYQDKVIVLRITDHSKILLNQLLPKPLVTYDLPLLFEVNRNELSIVILCW